MTAWSVLTAGSTAPPESTAWIHLNSQASGPITIILGGMLELDLNTTLLSNLLLNILESNIAVPVFSADLTATLSSNLTNTLEAIHEC